MAAIRSSLFGSFQVCAILSISNRAMDRYSIAFPPKTRMKSPSLADALSVLPKSAL